MNDNATGLPLRLSRDGRAGPYLILRFDQLAFVRKVLDEAAIRYWVDETAIAMSGGPVMSVINFSRSRNPDEIQSVLDRAVCV